MNPLFTLNLNVGYAKDFEFIGIVIYISSGCVICTRCCKGVQLNQVKQHLIWMHDINRFIRQQNQSNDANIDLVTLELSLCRLGACSVTDMCLYIAPLKEPLPVIRALKASNGYMRNYCPNMVTSATAYFTSKETTMKKHIYIHQRSHQSDNYISCIMQRLFDGQALMVYFRVVQEYVGPTIESTITKESEHLFQRFLDSNQDFSTQYTP